MCFFCHDGSYFSACSVGENCPYTCECVRVCVFLPHVSVRDTHVLAEAVVKKWKTKEKKTLPKFGLASWLEGTKCNSFNYQFCFLPSRAIRIVK